LLATLKEQTMRFQMLAPTLAALAGAACAANPARVSVTADPVARTLILGEWTGNYYTSDEGRAGSIVFKFEQHDTTEFACYGDVVMVARSLTRPVLPADEGLTTQPEDAVRVLAIEHVRVTGRQVAGAMAPYQDPDTGETLSTTFEGWVDGDIIKGTLLTIHAKSGIRDEGTWEVTRQNK